MLSESTRGQHTYIIGQTGTGKTTLLKTMILADMKAGNGLAVIDPHGELYDDLLALIPENRKNDVVLLDPSETEFPVGFNLLHVKHDDEREAVIKEMRAILKRYIFEYYSITDGGYAGPVFFQHIQNNLLLASSDINNPGTILEANNIFIKPGYYQRWLPLKWQNHILSDWVTNSLPNIDYQSFSRDGGMYGDYFSGKLSDFTNDPRVSLIFGQPYSTIDIADIIEKKKILLINLSKGLLGEASASLLGMILMAKFSTAFMERRKYLEEGKKLTPFYLYVDEFQNIATENFSILLSEARKFGLGLILANQFISQVREKNIREAIFGNLAR
jgi:energy-coupling factor transporter ATP-binding protein EcfA2